MILTVKPSSNLLFCKNAIYGQSERRDTDDPALPITAEPDYSVLSAKFRKKLVRISQVFADTGKSYHLSHRMYHYSAYRKFEILIIFLIFRSSYDILYYYYCIQRQIARKGDSKWLLVIRNCGTSLLTEI